MSYVQIESILVNPPYNWSRKRIKKCSRWYLANVLWRPTDPETHVPLPSDRPKAPKLDSLHSISRYWGTYLGVSTNTIDLLLKRATPKTPAPPKRRR